MGILKKVLKLISNRITVTVVAMALQFFWWFFLVLYLTDNNVYLNIFMWVVAFVIVIWVINRRINPGYKLIWAILILSMPIVGLIFWFVGGKSRMARIFQRDLRRVQEEHGDIMPEDPEVRKELEETDRRIANQSWYMTNTIHMPVYRHTRTEYFSVGEDWFARYVEELQKAKHYIFMEYFILEEGYMWNTILHILEEKVREGVDVRVIYDGVGCLTRLPYRYYRKLQAMGIKCVAFNQFRPLLNLILNNRDHRKITVIDGHTAFNGGINLADEYINQGSRFGHWKDSGICIHGEAAWSMTVMFLQMWSVLLHESCDFEKYRPHVHWPEAFPSDGFVQPYGDSPLDDETVGENVYRNIIGSAKDYVYIFTPYLVLDNEMMTELCNAARRGVDVRIVTPGIPDKKKVFLLTQSYYEQLLEAGVRIFQYTPGFIHSKSFVCDDEVAVVGTINLDYRSLYLHFECGTWLYRTESVAAVKQDALETFEVSREIDLDFCRNRGLLIRFFQSILRIIAPTL